MLPMSLSYANVSDGLSKQCVSLVTYSDTHPAKVLSSCCLLRSSTLNFGPGVIVGSAAWFGDTPLAARLTASRLEPTATCDNIPEGVENKMPCVRLVGTVIVCAMRPAGIY